MPFVFSTTNTAANATAVSSSATCPNKGYVVPINCSQRVAKTHMTMSSVAEGTRLMTQPTYPSQGQPESQSSQSSYMISTSKTAQEAPASRGYSRAALFQSGAQTKMQAYLQRRQPHFEVKPSAPKSLALNKPSIRARSPITQMQICAEPITKIDEDYMQNQMDTTNHIYDFQSKSSRSFFDQEVLVNIMNFERVQDCILKMKLFDNLKMNQPESQLDYSILLDSETVGIENELDNFEVSGIHHLVTLRCNNGEPDKIKRQTEKELGQGPYNAVAYDLPVSSTRSGKPRCVRMWKPEAVTILDKNPLKQFQATNSLEQQYFVISASLQDLMAKYLDEEKSFDKFKKNVVIEFDDNLNMSIAQLEFIRILRDQHDFTTEEANEMTKTCFKAIQEATSKNPDEGALLDQFMSTLPQDFDILEQLEKIKCIKSCFADFDVGNEIKETKVLVVDSGQEKSLITHDDKNGEERVYHKFSDIAYMIDECMI